MVPHRHLPERLRQVLSFGVRMYQQPSPFHHTKLVLIDDSYALVGSANLDPHSLRLNLEVCRGAFRGKLDKHHFRARNAAREITMDELAECPLWERPRDPTASLFSPYLGFSTRWGGAAASGPPSTVTRCRERRCPW